MSGPEAHPRGSARISISREIKRIGAGLVALASAGPPVTSPWAAYLSGRRTVFASTTTGRPERVASRPFLVAVTDAVNPVTLTSCPATPTAAPSGVTSTTSNTTSTTGTTSTTTDETPTQTGATPTETKPRAIPASSPAQSVLSRVQSNIPSNPRLATLASAIADEVNFSHHPPNNRAVIIACQTGVASSCPSGISDPIRRRQLIATIAFARHDTATSPSGARLSATLARPLTASQRLALERVLGDVALLRVDIHGYAGQKLFLTWRMYHKENACGPKSSIWPSPTGSRRSSPPPRTTIRQTSPRLNVRDGGMDAVRLSDSGSWWACRAPCLTGAIF
jgi:hypothetical protein